MAQMTGTDGGYVSTSGGGGGAGAFPEPTPTNSLWNERLGGYIGNLGLTSPNGGMARSTSSTLDLNTGAGEVVNNGIVYIILGAVVFIVISIFVRR